MRTLILGAEGMAGHMVSQYLAENNPRWEIIPWARKDFEIHPDNVWKNKIIEFNSYKKIDYIINCIGILKKANQNPILGIRINSLFPHELAELASSIKTKVIHLSTDCWNDLDVYGRSKRAGELNYADHLTIRTSIIGPELKKDGTGLFHWFMMQDKEANGFVNHYWDGVTTLELSRNIEKILKQNPSLNYTKDLRSKNKISKFELLDYIKQTFNKSILINKKETDIVDKSNSLAEIIVETSLKSQIEELKNWMCKHKSLYSQYGI